MNDLMAHKQLAVLTTEVNPFNIYQTLEKSKSKGPAKGGETADEDIIIEIGPGKGAITEKLSKKCKKIIALEIDPKWVAYLRNKTSIKNYN